MVTGMGGFIRYASVLALMAIAIGAPAARADTGVVGDDSRDRFVGTGGVLVDSVDSDVDPGRVIDCPGCRWRATSACDERGDGSCVEQNRGCPAGMTKLRIWLTRPGEAERLVGTTCAGPGGPVSQVAWERALADRFVRRVPPIRPSVLPRGAALTGLPVVVSSGQPRLLSPRTYRILGRAVTLSARPRWTWSSPAASPSTLLTSDPGVAASSGALRLLFGSPGRHAVTVSCAWTGTYTVDGRGPYAVSVPLRQTARLFVRVVRGSTHLVG